MPPPSAGAADQRPRRARFFARLLAALASAFRSLRLAAAEEGRAAPIPLGRRAALPTAVLAEGSPQCRKTPSRSVGTTTTQPIATGSGTATAGAAAAPLATAATTMAPTTAGRTAEVTAGEAAEGTLTPLAAQLRALIPSQQPMRPTRRFKACAVASPASPRPLSSSSTRMGRCGPRRPHGSPIGTRCWQSTLSHATAP